jgi:hypothetical protein
MTPVGKHFAGDGNHGFMVRQADWHSQAKKEPPGWGVLRWHISRSQYSLSLAASEGAAV